MNTAPSIAFDVSYRLGEYLEFVRARVATALLEHASRSGKGTSRLQACFVWCLLSVIGTVSFFYKTLRVGTCHFQIYARQIVRRSRTGTVVVPWSAIVAVDRYAPGYLLAGAKGAIPIPFRVLSGDERKTLEGIVAVAVSESRGDPAQKRGLSAAQRTP